MNDRHYGHYWRRRSSRDALVAGFWHHEHEAARGVALASHRAELQPIATLLKDTKHSPGTAGEPFTEKTPAFLESYLSNIRRDGSPSTAT